MQKESKEKLKKFQIYAAICIFVIISVPFLSIFIQINSDGKYNLFGALPRLDIKLSKNEKYDFQIKEGIWPPQTIEIFSRANESEMLWKIRFFNKSDSEQIKYFSYGNLPEGNVFQVYPSVGLRDGNLSYNEQQSANKVSRKGTPPRELKESEIVAIKISSYCGHGFEQPNCRETRIFQFINGRFISLNNR